MRFVWVATAVLAGLAVLPAPVDAASEPDARWLLFSGGDIASTSAFSYSGARVGLTAPLDAGGFFLEGLAGHGQYRYATTSVARGRIDGRLLLGQAGGGYQWRFSHGGLALSGGARVETHRLSQRDPSNAAGTGVAPYLALDLWAKPAPDLLVTGQANASGLVSGYFVRLTAAHALRAGAELRLGAEAVLMGGDSYRQMRLGGLLTGLDIGVASLWASSGLARDQDGGGGLYGALGIWRKF